MLKVRVSYRNVNPMIMLKNILTPALSKLVETDMHEQSKEIIISFSEKLSYEQYASIHRFLILLAKQVNGRIFDKGCLLGYLKDGTPAYIVTNWNEWSRFLHEEKLKAAQGEYVHAYANGELLDSGILLEYELNAEGETFAVRSCTLLTSDGEQTIYGDALLLEAEQRF